MSLYAMPHKLIALILVVAAPLLLFGQTTGQKPTPATIATAKQTLIEMQPRSGLLNEEGLRTGPDAGPNPAAGLV